MPENAPTASSTVPAQAPRATSAPPPLAPPRETKALPSPGKDNHAPAPARQKDEDKQESAAKHTVWVVVILVLIGVGIAYVIATHKGKPVQRTPPPITVSVTNAVKGNIDESVPALGTVTPIYTAQISPRVDGQLIRVNYTEGQMVNPNDLLAEIDPGPYQAAVTQAEGQLARDKAMLEGANVDLQRYKDAYAKSIGSNVLHAVPKQQVDDQQALVHQDEGAVKLDEGNLATARVNLAYCSIRAPFKGRVGLRLIDPGNVVHAANTNALVTVTQLQPITVIFGVDQKYLDPIQRELRAGHTMAVEAYNEDNSKKLATGSFQTLDNLIDTGTGNIRIRAMFDNANLELFPNQFVNVKLITQVVSNVTLIPTPAIQRSPDGAFVYLVQQDGTNQIVKTNTIVPKITDGDISSVTGLEPGQVVVTDNYNKLADGMKVNVRKPGQRQGGRGEPPSGDHKGGGHKKEKDQSKQGES
jgi:membrane fusion protein, multidrug efflux system